MSSSRADHSSGRPLGVVIDELAAELRFLLWQTGVE